MRFPSNTDPPKQMPKWKQKVDESKENNGRNNEYIYISFVENPLMRSRSICAAANSSE